MATTVKSATLVKPPIRQNPSGGQRAIHLTNLNPDLHQQASHRCKRTKSPCRVCARRNKLMYARPGSRRDGYERVIIPVIGDIQPIIPNNGVEKNDSPRTDRSVRNNYLSTVHMMKSQAVLDRAAETRILSTSYNSASFVANQTNYMNRQLFDFRNVEDPLERLNRLRNSIEIKEQPLETNYDPGLFKPIKTSPFNEEYLRKIESDKEKERQRQNKEIMAKLGLPDTMWEMSKADCSPDDKRRRYPPFWRREFSQLLEDDSVTQGDILRNYQRTLLNIRENEVHKLLHESSHFSTPPNSPGLTLIPALSSRSATMLTATTEQTDGFTDDGELQVKVVGPSPDESPMLPPLVEHSLKKHLSNMPIWGKPLASGNTSAQSEVEGLGSLATDLDRMAVSGIESAEFRKDDDEIPIAIMNKQPVSRKSSEKSSSAKIASGKGSERNSAYYKRLTRQRRREMLLRSKTLTPDLSSMYDPSKIFWEFNPYTNSPVFWQNMIDLVETPPTPRSSRNRTTADYWWKEKPERADTLLSGESLFNPYALSKRQAQSRLHSNPSDDNKSKQHRVNRNKPVAKSVPLYRSFHEPPGRY